MDRLGLPSRSNQRRRHAEWTGGRVTRRTEQRGFDEVDLRRMLEHAQRVAISHVRVATECLPDIEAEPGS